MQRHPEFRIKPLLPLTILVLDLYIRSRAVLCSFGRNGMFDRPLARPCLPMPGNHARMSPSPTRKTMHPPVTETLEIASSSLLPRVPPAGQGSYRFSVAAKLRENCRAGRPAWWGQRSTHTCMACDGLAPVKKKIVYGHRTRGTEFGDHRTGDKTSSCFVLGKIPVLSLRWIGRR